MKRLNLTTLPALIFFLSVALIYWTHLPWTVQAGDSGELVAAAHKLLVPHPPGYPLWVWTHHLWELIFPFSTVVYKAAFLNALFSLGTLALVYSLLGSTPLALFLTAIVSVNPVFWKYAEIPEVFSLHIFISVLFIYFSFSKKIFRLGTSDIPIACLSPIIFGLGCSHHHTIVFLFPILLFNLWKLRRNQWFYVSSAIGILIMVCFYLSMLALDTKHLYSWGNLSTANDVLDHFLRKSYGTLKLVAGQSFEKNGPIFYSFFYFLATQAWPVLLLALALLISYAKNRKLSRAGINWALFASFAAYVLIFMSMANQQAFGFIIEVVHRFFILPFVLLVLSVGLFFEENFPTLARNKMFFILAALFLSIYGQMHSPEKDFSKNTLVEDYAINILKVTSEAPNRILFLTGDSEIFASRFAQTVLEVEPEAIVSNYSNISAKWFDKKVKAARPEWIFPLEDFEKKGVVDFVNGILIPNSPKFSIFASVNMYGPDVIQSVFYPLGIQLLPGKGYETKKTIYTPEFRSDISLIEVSPFFYNSFRLLFSRYSYYFIIEGQNKYSAGDAEGALSSFEKALQIFPFNRPALENICKIAKSQGRDEPKCKHLLEIREYYDYFRVNGVGSY